MLRSLCIPILAITLLAYVCFFSAQTAHGAGVRMAGDVLLLLLGGEKALEGDVELEVLWTEGGAPRLLAKIKELRLELPWIQGVFQAQAFIRLHQGALYLDAFSLTSTNAVFRYQGQLLGPMPLTLAGQASKRLDNDHWTLSQVRLDVGEALHLQGQAAYSPGAGLQAGLAGEVGDARALRDIFKPFMPAVLSDARATGRIGVSCTIAPAEDGKGRSKLEAVLQPRGLILWAREEAGALSGLAQLKTVLDATGKPLSWTLESSLRLPGGSFFQGAQLGLALEGGADAAQIKHCQLHPLGPGAASPLEIEGALLLDAANSLIFREVKLSSAGLGGFEGRLALGESSVDGAFQGKGLDLQKWLAWAQTVWLGPWMRWNPTGEADCSLSVSGTLQEPRLQGALALKRLACASPDGLLLAEGVAADLAWQLSLGATLQGELSLRSAQGGILYDTVFLDLGAHALQAAAKLGLTEKSVLSISSLHVALEGLGLVRGGGAVKFGQAIAYDLQATVSRLELENVFTTCIKEPLSGSHPHLAGATMRGGASMEIAAVGTNGRAALRGELDLVDAGFSTGPEGLSIEGLRLHLPFSYDLGRAPGRQSTRTALNIQWGAAQNAGNSGSLAIARLSTPLGTLEHVAMPVSLAPNQLGLDGTLEAPLFGGVLALHGIRVLEPLSENFMLTCQARLRDVDLSKIKTGAVPLHGRLGGDLGEISLSQKALNVPGALQGSFYGGELRISSIRGTTPISAGRQIMADVSIRRMVLERFSQALDLGTVTGRLDIGLQGLALAYNQPVAFHLEVRSVPEDGVDQEISLKAVNAIAVVGTGQGLTGAGVGLFASFFKTFSYESIGFACDLHNDIFRIRGLINQGGVEYLVKKPPLFGINVVNGNPDNRISFSDMQKRLERVLRPGDTALSSSAQEVEEVPQ